MATSATQTLLRGLSVLEALASAHPLTLGPTQLAAMSGLDKATAIRLARTLVQAGYVEQGEKDRAYGLTRKVLKLSANLTWELDLRTLVRPHLVEMRDRSGETVHLGCLDGCAVRYVDKLESNQSIRLVSAVGQLMPIHTTALGKALLTGLPEADRAALIQQIDFAESSLGLAVQASFPPDERVKDIDSVRREASSSGPPPLTREELIADVEESIRRGYSIARVHALSVGANILGRGNQLLGAISIAGPHFRMEHRLAELGELCRKTAIRISQEAQSTALASPA